MNFKPFYHQTILIEQSAAVQATVCVAYSVKLQTVYLNFACILSLNT